MIIPDIGYPAILNSLQVLFTPGRIIEVRILSEDRIASGYYDDFEKAANDILIQEQDVKVTGIYVTLNEVRPALLARRANRIKTRLGRADGTTADSDIVRRRWLPIDIDPIRASGISSTESEHADAITLAKVIATWLSDNEWPDPIVADSGNGAHLLYPIDLPNDEDSRDLVKSILELLDRQFSTARCKVDTANFNASRIWKVYGTFSRKGDNIADRPHRRSQILTIPDNLSPISKENLKNLIYDTNERNILSVSALDSTTRSEYQETDSHRNNNGQIIDLGAWLTKYHLDAMARPYQGGTLYSFEQCPFSNAHRDGAYAIQFSNGAIFAGCHHDSCGNGRQRWPELRANFEHDEKKKGAAVSKKRAEHVRDITQNKQTSTLKNCPQSPAGSDDFFDTTTIVHSDQTVDQVSERAQKILFFGNPLSFLLDVFASSHEGDQIVAECFIHSLASRSVINSKGLHVSITGESGKGKSHAIETMKSLIPGETRLDGRMSDKALFYMDNIRPGTVISLDDVSLSDQMQEILKGVTTSFQKPFLYRTVNIERRAQLCTIPERCVWWIAKVEGVGDDQVFNRMLTCWIDDSEDQDQKVLDRTLDSAEQIPGLLKQINEDMQVCRKIWAELDHVHVIIPFARRIRFHSAENRRNPDMLLDLIRTNAALLQYQREKRTSDDLTCIMATEEDFNEAARLFIALNSDTGGQGTKLTRRETSLIGTIASMQNSEMTIADLQRATGWTNSTINKLLHGYRSRGKSYSGILEKCPAISFLDKTVSIGDDGYTTLRRNKAYLWDAELYNAWQKGGSVWLASDKRANDHQDLPPDSPDDGSNAPIENSEKNYGGKADIIVIDQISQEEKSEVSSLVLVSDKESLADTDPAKLDHPKKGDQSGVSLSSIKPQDFIRVEGSLDRRRCSVCGKRNTRYQERPGTIQTSNQDRSPLVLCPSCYQRAVSHEIASIVPLPGMINREHMTQSAVSLGRCQLCEIKPATWSDQKSHTHLCDSCYHRCSNEERPIHQEK